MPNLMIKSFAEKTGKSVSDVEDLWKKAKEIAKENNQKNNYKYITGVLKKMLGV